MERSFKNYEDDHVKNGSQMFGCGLNVCIWIIIFNTGKRCNRNETTNNFTVSPFANDPGGAGGSCSDWEYVYAYDGSRFGICTWHLGRTMIVDWSVETTWPMSYLTVAFSFSDGKKITVTRRPNGLFGQYGEEEHAFSSGGKKSVKMSGTVSGYYMDYGVFNTTAYETLP